MSRLIGKLQQVRSTRMLYVGTQPLGQTAFADRTRRRLRRLEKAAAARLAQQQTTTSALRSLRGEVTALRRAADDTSEVVNDLTRLVLRLASAGGSGAGGAGGARVVDAGEAVVSARLLLRLGEPLAADRLVQDFDLLPRLSTPQLRTLHRELRGRGYLPAALGYMRELAVRGTDNDRRALPLREGEVAVMSGSFTARLESEPVTGVPGRILHVVGYSRSMRQTGFTIRTHYTALAQLAAGFEPHVVSQAGNNVMDLPDRETVDDVAYHHAGGPPRESMAMDDWLQLNAEEVLRAVREVRPVVLHAHSDFLNFLTAQAVGRATGLPVVYEARGFWEESWLSRTADRYGWDDLDAIRTTYGLPEAYTWRLQREVEARAAADHLVTLSRGMADQVVAAGVPRSRVSLAPNAVHAADFERMPRDELLAAECGIPEGATVIGYISSLVEYEGIDVLLGAFAQVRASSERPLHLLIVGDGAERDNLERKARQLGADGITFTGKVPHADVPRYYSLIDLFVVPRTPAPVCQLVTPLKPFEAFACGRTVVFSDVDALREIAEDSQAALTFEAGNPDSLADLLRSLLADPERCAQLAQRGYDWVRAERTWGKNAAAYREVYRALGA